MSSFVAAKQSTQTIYAPYSKSISNSSVEVEEEQLEELKEAFQLFDTEHKGRIDSREFKAALRALGYDITKSDVIKCFSDLGKTLEDSINYDEFMKVVIPHIKPRNSREEIMKIFRLFDEDNTGKISIKNLRKVAKDLGEDISDNELKELIKEADRDNDGLVSPEDFYRVMSKDNDDPLAEFDSDSD